MAAVLVLTYCLRSSELGACQGKRLSFEVAGPAGCALRPTTSRGAYSLRPLRWLANSAHCASDTRSLFTALALVRYGVAPMRAACTPLRPSRCAAFPSLAAFASLDGRLCPSIPLSGRATDGMIAPFCAQGPSRRLLSRNRPIIRARSRRKADGISFRAGGSCLSLEFSIFVNIA